ncbi:hypothetical protein DPMN_159974 [Dreissena polymorpha]|uniref:Uncharacterized protein n=1 Tax=Dreissena polymorpha TaxID=45954 RepID=A0A9D4ELW9_DREPO|nr:hypothetical protein DPMN_159974 [Dreissena polymorpha]
MYSVESNEAVPHYAPVGQIPYAAPKVPNSHFLAPTSSTIEGYVNVPTYSIGDTSRNQLQTGLDIISEALATLN